MKHPPYRYFLVGFPRFMLQRLRREAKIRGLSVAAFVRLCIGEYFNQIDSTRDSHG